MSDVLSEGGVRAVQAAQAAQIALEAEPGAGPERGPAEPWILRHTTWFLVLIHIPAVGIAWSDAAFGTAGGLTWNPFGVTALTLVVGGIQLRHSLAAARGERPRGWLWTWLALLALAFVPLIWLTWNWLPIQPVVTASALMLLPRRLAIPIAAAVVLGGGISAAVYTLPFGPAATSAEFAYYSVSSLIAGVVLYGAARLLLVLRQLHATRVELAGLAVVQERLRVSRDLHDLLGQSLSAISLKGDLALRLLHRDPPAARGEIESLTGMARDTLRDVRFVAKDQLAVSLDVEADGAAAVLSAAGVKAMMSIDLPGLEPSLQRVLAWAVREGVTNILRHSEARTCSITAGREGGAVRLEIVNDGARPGAAKSGGGGLDGLVERARELSGTVAAGPAPDSTFRLVVCIPEPEEVG